MKSKTSFEQAKTEFDKVKISFLNNVQLHENEFRKFNTKELKNLFDSFECMLTGLLELEKKIDKLGK